MDLGIEGETALVMSSTRGLGFSCAEALVAEGVRVVINGRDADRGRDAEASLGKQARFVRADVGEPAGIDTLLSETEKHLGSISILVTNVEGPPPRSFLEATGEDWRLAYERGVHSMLEVVRRCIPAMQKRGFGRIVNISSISAKEITVNGLLANAFRPALVGALGTLAREVAPDGVTVNNILPGPFDTDWLRHVARAHADAGELSEENAVAAYAQSGPMQRLGEPEEFGALCAFLCSRKAGHLTGQGIVIDGGRVRTLL